MTQKISNIYDTYQRRDKKYLLAKSSWMDNPTDSNTRMWYHLLFWAESQYDIQANLARIDHSIYRAPSPRQKEIQRLWQQRGLLERTKANIYSVMRSEGIFNSEESSLYFGYTVITKLIERNKNEMATVKERIPK